jgi:hypothetical protein
MAAFTAAIFNIIIFINYFQVPEILTIVELDA